MGVLASPVASRLPFESSTGHAAFSASTRTRYVVITSGRSNMYVMRRKPCAGARDGLSRGGHLGGRARSGAGAHLGLALRAEDAVGTVEPRELRVVLRAEAHFTHKREGVGDGVDGEHVVGDGVLLLIEVAPVDRDAQQLQILAMQHERSLGRTRSAAQLHLAEDNGARIVKIKVEVDGPDGEGRRRVVLPVDRSRRRLRLCPGSACSREQRAQLFADDGRVAVGGDGERASTDGSRDVFLGLVRRARHLRHDWRGAARGCGSR